MANSDYSVTGTGVLAAAARLAAGVSYLTTTLYYDTLRTPSVVPPAVGEAIMIGSEIMGIVSFSSGKITVSRGCMDTVPAPHSIGAKIWFLLGLSSDRVVYAEGEEVGVKASPRGVTKPAVALANTPAQGLRFAGRFYRPYPPGNVLVNGDPWFTVTVLHEDDMPEMVLTWKHRDRITQADQLVGHTANNVGPEPGTVYMLRFYAADAPETLLAEYEIDGNTFTYTHEAALVDFDSVSVPVGEEGETLPVQAFARLASVRDDVESLMDYRINFGITKLQPYGLGYRLGESLGGVEI